MEAVARAFVNSKPACGISIGILPCSNRDVTRRPPGYPNPFVQLVVATHLRDRGRRGHLPSSRNHLNVLNSDAIVALPGSHGTESEIRLALTYAKPLIIYCADRSAVAHFPDKVARTESLVEVEAFLNLVL